MEKLEFGEVAVLEDGKEYESHIQYKRSSKATMIPPKVIFYL